MNGDPWTAPERCNHEPRGEFGRLIKRCGSCCPCELCRIWRLSQSKPA